MTMIDKLRRTFLFGAGGTLGAVAFAPALAASPEPAEAVDLLSTYVAGTAYHDGAGAAMRLRPGERLELRRAPDNPYDARTIEVWTRHREKLGHMPGIDSRILARLMDAGFEAAARVRSVTPHPVRPEIRFEVSMRFVKA
jgi:hypothetical protein